MINNLKLKIVTIYNSKRNFFNIIILFFLVILIFVIFSQKRVEPNPTNNVINNTPSSIPIQSSTDKDKYLTFNDKESFYINQIITNNDIVTGFSWLSDKNIYSTTNGIFEAGTNEVIVKSKISDIQWADNFNAVVRNDNKWKIFNYKDKSLIEIPVILNNPSISNNGDKIVDFNKNNLNVYYNSDFTPREIKFEEPIQKLFMTTDSDNIVVLTNYATKSYVYFLDKDLKITKKLETGDDYKLASISPDGNILALVLDNNLRISDFNNLIVSDVYLEKSELSVGFRTNSEFVVIEKYKDNLGRILDNIYISNLTGKRFRISDSKQIINRINLEIPMKFNSNRTIVTFGENKGKTWILTLIPNIFPTYSTTGELVFSKIKPNSH